ncbi:DUF2145 domain-containing protein [Maricaulis sp. D1M11]|uniref:DUF2145 domain-containing protein n=1 Tax=Maricaulis sp. D1M11 TaxID=3076117 RepID=UPI0039B5200E
MKYLFAGLLITLAVGLSSPAMALSDGRAATRFSLQEAADFSKYIEYELAYRGAHVAIVYRSDDAFDSLPGHVPYSHASFWVYTPIDAADGRTLYGYTVFNLYHRVDRPGESYLVQDWPLNFARSDVTGRVGVIVPLPEMQNRILDVMASPIYEDLHNPDYSLISNPNDLRLQNSTEFVLDVVSSAAWEIDAERERIKVNINAYFDPTELAFSGWDRFAAPLFNPALRLDDQGDDVQMADFRSMSEFMSVYNLAQAVFELESTAIASAGASVPTASSHQ